MQLHDAARDAQADARSVGLGREERREDIFGYFGGDCPAVVANLDNHVFLRVYARRDFDAGVSPCPYRFAGILEQVHHILFRRSDCIMRKT